MKAYLLLTVLSFVEVIVIAWSVTLGFALGHDIYQQFTRGYEPLPLLFYATMILLTCVGNGNLMREFHRAIRS